MFQRNKGIFFRFRFLWSLAYHPRQRRSLSRLITHWSAFQWGWGVQNLLSIYWNDHYWPEKFQQRGQVRSQNCNSFENPAIRCIYNKNQNFTSNYFNTFLVNQSPRRKCENPPDHSHNYDSLFSWNKNSNIKRRCSQVHLSIVINAKF